MDSTVRILLNLVLVALYLTVSHARPDKKSVNVYENQKLPDIPGYIPVYIKAETPTTAFKSQPLKNRPKKKENVKHHVRPQETADKRKTNVHKKEDEKLQVRRPDDSRKIHSQKRESRSAYGGKPQHGRPERPYEQSRPEYNQEYNKQDQQYRPSYNKPQEQYRPDSGRPNEQYRPDNRPNEQYKGEFNRPNEQYNRPNEQYRPEHNRPSHHQQGSHHQGHNQNGNFHESGGQHQGQYGQQQQQQQQHRPSYSG